MDAVRTGGEACSVSYHLYDGRSQTDDKPTSLETMEGKTMAIDSSIWIYQFQATMRDKEGRGLVNAHIVGFLRRICKLLFYGIKPVFVFDGGAPALKRSTIVSPVLCCKKGRHAYCRSTVGEKEQESWRSRESCKGS